jgi:ribonuclease D
MTSERVSTNNDADVEIDGDVLWPLAYRLQTLQQPAFVRWWSYRLYQNPEGERFKTRRRTWLTLHLRMLGETVKVLYSNNKAKSEEILQQFLDEPVVGFDMEWPCFPGQNPPLQKRIGLIQIASEDKIALIHLGLHAGKTTDDIIAPSLRKLIESPKIAKTGVGILGADFARLSRFFGLKPQGAFELSHLDCLVRFAYIPHLLNTKMISLANLVENHLGLPLAKGPVRTSNWSRPLNDEQKNYAASDAYAGFMLFHCMNAKRLALTPVPSLPIFAEQYPRKAKGTKGFAPITTLMLHPTEEGGSIVAAREFFGTQKEEVNSDEKSHEEKEVAPTLIAEKGNKTTKKTAAKTPQEPLNSAAQILYDQLAERRKALAQAHGVPVYLIANNSVLHGLAHMTPQNDAELLKVKGIGKVSVAKYGADWLDVIAHHLAAQPTAGPSTASAESEGTVPGTPPQKAIPRSDNIQHSPNSSPAFGSPIYRTPGLHTGLSFALAETALDTGDNTDGSPRYPVLRRSMSDQQDGDIELIDMTGAKPHDHRLAAGVGQTGNIDALPDVSSGATSEGTAWRNVQSPSSSEDSLVFITPPSRSASYLKRKRTETRSCTATPSRAQTQPVPPGLDLDAEVTPTRVSTQPLLLSPRSKIFRNKLVAFSKLVTRKLNAGFSTAPIVSEATLDLIVAISPRTAEELDHIAGIEAFACACRNAEMDLLRNIIKFAPPS